MVQTCRNIKLNTDIYIYIYIKVTYMNFIDSIRKQTDQCAQYKLKKARVIGNNSAQVKIQLRSLRSCNM